MPEYKKPKERQEEINVYKYKFAADSSKPEGERRGDLYQKRVDLATAVRCCLIFQEAL
jgi:hypothetical protein